MGNRFLPLYNQYKKSIDKLTSVEETHKLCNKQIQSHKKITHNHKMDVSLSERLWYLNDNLVKLEKNQDNLCINHNDIKSGFFYISFKEKNVDFSKPPIEKLVQTVNQNYYISFWGEKQLDVRVELFIIGYQNNKRILVKSYALNTSEVFQLDRDLDAIRISIRIAGKGNTMIKQLQILPLDHVQIAMREQVATTESVIEKSEYEWKTVLSTSNFFRDCWYIPNTNYFEQFEINKEGIEAKVSFPNDKYQYISYQENDVNYSKPPIKSCIEVKTNVVYEIKCLGEKQDTVNVQLFLIFYTKEGEKAQVEVINLNEKRSFKLGKNISFCRIAIKFAGQGNMRINDIQINQKKEIDFLPFNILRKIGFDAPKKMSDVRMAVICDEFTMQCIEPECQLIKVGPDNWKAMFSIHKPHILFVESAWHGNSGLWTRKVSKINQTNTQELVELVQWCKKNDVPTVFWNKEDPVHYNSFIETAKEFDYIFTTDENSVENYKRNVKHKNVYSLPFAAQPVHHNPIELYDRNPGICFAGSYYRNKYIERQIDMDILLRASANFGLTIYDRNYGKELIEFYFPDYLRQYVKGSLKASEIDKAYKGYKIALNVNSVVSSPTMFSRRVFECLASNTPVVSTFSLGIKNIFEDIVYMGETEQQFKEELEKLLNNDCYYQKQALLGLRHVLQNHTYKDRLHYVMDKVGISLVIEKPTVNVISIVNNADEVDLVLKNFQGQDYLSKHLTIIVEDMMGLPTLNEDNCTMMTKQQFIEKGLDKITSYISYFEPFNFYGKYYLTDLILATKYSNAEVIGKGSYFEYEKALVLYKKEERYVYTNYIQIDRALIFIGVLKNLSLEQLLELCKQRGGLSSLVNKGYRMFSIDSYNFISNFHRAQEDEQVYEIVDKTINI